MLLHRFEQTTSFPNKLILTAAALRQLLGALEHTVYRQMQYHQQCFLKASD